ncbi:sialate O-acetylesterase [Bifidobacterium oedipodis]|nr:sialate O-acetylesterase [Bifidobacterium sp. DSM 109957]
MVLQRNRPAKVWGICAAGESVHVSIDDIEATAVADEQGHWQAVLQAHQAGGPFVLEATTANDERVVALDVMFGDVWVLAGQSNMELWMGRVATMFPGEIESANDTNIRLFAVPQTFDFVQPHRDLPGGTWIQVGRDDISGMSAVGYFFAKQLRQDIGVPIGLIATAIGGTHIEAWMSRNNLESIGCLPKDFDRLVQPGYVQREQQRYADYERQYMADLDEADLGLREHWQSADFNDADWPTMSLNESRRPELRASGAIWIRKRIRVPDEFVGKPAQLRLGTMVDADECYLDGQLIGQTGYRYPPRNYDIECLPEECTLAIRLLSFSGQGQLTENKRHVLIDTEGRQFDLDSLGAWHVMRGCTMPDRREQEFFSHMAVGDFNAMIMPLTGLSVTGVLWYQGESNAHAAPGYARMLAALIQEWREVFERADLPFLFAQLPNYTLEPDCDWPRLRDEQRKVLALRHTAMIVTIGFGENNDLHPLDKRSVGERFALAARSVAYGEACESMGPLPVRAVRTHNAVIVDFVHVAGGLQASGDVEFDILEPGGTAYHATAVADTVRDYAHVCIPLDQDIALRRGTVIRYGWSNAPDLTLWNDQGLPATPFELLIQ